MIGLLKKFWDGVLSMEELTAARSNGRMPAYQRHGTGQLRRQVP
jgi:hypothetical protein